MPYTPIVFAAYLETLSGDLSWGYYYLVEVALVVVCYGINALNISIVGDIINFFMLLSMVPLLIGFFWVLPDIEISQWTETCSNYDPALFLAVIVYYAGGYEYLGAVGGELNFSARKLMISYIVAVIVSVLWVIIPVIVAATIPYSSCSDWYDGYFAVAYGEIWKPLYYMVLIASLFCMFAYTILYCTE